MTFRVEMTKRNGRAIPLGQIAAEAFRVLERRKRIVATVRWARDGEDEREWGLTFRREPTPA